MLSEPSLEASPSSTVTLKLYAIYQEVIGQPELVMALLPGDTVGDLFRRILETYPSLERWQNQTRFGLNLDFVEGDALLTPGDEVVFIPPVSGG